MERAIKEILKNVGDESDLTPYFPKEEYKAIDISDENFKEIKNIESDKTIAFIDGGNQEVIGANNFSLQLIKTCATTYKDNKNVSRTIYEAYALISTKNKDGELGFEIKMFFTKKTLGIENLRIDLFDKTMMQGQHQVKIEYIGDAVRKYMELLTAKKTESDIIVLDRTLESNITGEKQLFEELYKQDKVICGFAKTTNLLTKNGNSIPAVLLNKRQGAWIYHPLVEIHSEDHKADVYLLKLHEKSKHVFRFEIEKGKNTDETISLLANNSKDPIFIGYPYGLVDADKFARVSNRETDMIKTRLFVKLGKDMKKINSYLSTKNAHSILDNIG